MQIMQCISIVVNVNYTYLYLLHMIDNKLLHYDSLARGVICYAFTYVIYVTHSTILTLHYLLIYAIQMLLMLVIDREIHCSAARQGLILK